MPSKIGTTTTLGETVVLTYDDGSVCTLESPPFEIEKRTISPFYNKNPQESMALDLNTNRIYIRDDNYKNLQVVDYTTNTLVATIVLPYNQRVNLNNIYTYASGKPYINFDNSTIYSVGNILDAGGGSPSTIRIHAISLNTYAIVGTFDITSTSISYPSRIDILGISNNQLFLFISATYGGDQVAVIDMSDMSIFKVSNGENISGIGASRILVSTVNNGAVLWTPPYNNFGVKLWYYLQDSTTSNVFNPYDDIVGGSVSINISIEVSVANNIILVLTPNYLFVYNLSTFALIKKTLKASYTGLTGILFYRNTRSIITVDTATNTLYQLKIT